MATAERHTTRQTNIEKRVDAFIRRHQQKRVGSVRDALIELADPKIDFAIDVANRLGVSLDAVIGTALRDHERVVFLDRDLCDNVEHAREAMPFLGETVRDVAIYAIRSFLIQHFRSNGGTGD